MVFLDHAETRFALMVENQEQVDKLIGIKQRLALLQRIIYKDPRGLRHYMQEYLVSLDVVQQQGSAFDAAYPGVFPAEVAKGSGSDLSVITYTSGTTGRPKGVMLSFDNLISAARLSVASIASMRTIGHWPICRWPGSATISSLRAEHGGGLRRQLPGKRRDGDGRSENRTQLFLRPTTYLREYPDAGEIRMEDAGLPKRSLFAFFLRVARRCGVRLLEGKPVSVTDRTLYALGDVLVFGPLRNALGFSRIRVAYTAGEAIGPDIFVFFRSLGINLKQLYGQTESSVYCCMQTDNDVQPDTVGPPAPGVEMKIADDGEIMYRSPGVFIGYYKNPEATAATRTPDGWVHTGDAGVFTENGHLRVVDRANDVGRLNDGTLFAPKYLENKLKFFSYIKEAVAFGDRRDFAACFINIDLDAVGKWVERRGIAYTSYFDLAGREEVYQLIAGNIAAVNRDLAEDAALVARRSGRFMILHKELDADDGELTRTRKVRRGTIAERYSDLVAALLGPHLGYGRGEVAFEDGRTAVVRADLKIRMAQTFAHRAAAA
jgi:long-chain acyl-CoA synthetase